MPAFVLLWYGFCWQAEKIHSCLDEILAIEQRQTSIGEKKRVTNVALGSGDGLDES